MSRHNGRRPWRALAAVLTGLALAVAAAGPAVADEDPGPGDGGYSYSVAFQGADGFLWTVDPNGIPHNMWLGMAEHTNPAALSACVAGVCRTTIAFQANTGILWTLDLRTGWPTNTGQPMLARTSPSITYTASGAVEVAYRGPNGNLFTYVAGSPGGVDTGIAVLGGSSPSISQTPNHGGPVIAYQRLSGGNMCLLEPDGDKPCADVAMDAASSPSITHVMTTAWPGDSVTVAFQAIDGVLYTYNAATGARATAFTMAHGTSPSVTGWGFIGADGIEVVQIAFQANTSALWRVAPALPSQQSWTVAVAAGTSPATRGSVIAFHGTDGRLWTVGATGVPTQSALGMAPGTSPAVF